MIILLPFFVLGLGLVIYFAAKTNTKVAEVGRIMFKWGLFFLMLVLLFSDRAAALLKF